MLLVVDFNNRLPKGKETNQTLMVWKVFRSDIISTWSCQPGCVQNTVYYCIVIWLCVLCSRPLLFQTSELIVSSPAVGDLIPYSTLLHFLLTRAPSELKSPHQACTHTEKWIPKWLYITTASKECLSPTESRVVHRPLLPVAWWSSLWERQAHSPQVTFVPLAFSFYRSECWYLTADTHTHTRVVVGWVQLPSPNVTFVNGAADT